MAKINDIVLACKDWEHDILEISEELIGPDPNCPDGSIINSGIIFRPDNPGYTRLAQGDVSAAKFKYWDEGDMFEEMGSGYECPTDCPTPEIVYDRAALQVMNQCVTQDWLVKMCSNPGDPNTMVFLADKRSQMFNVEAERRAILAMLGVYNAAVAAGGMQIMWDFCAAPLDGSSTDITPYGLAQAQSNVNALAPDYFIAPHPVMKKLAVHGFQPFCCTDSGQRRNQVQAMIGPNGEIFIPAPKRFTPYFNLGDDGSGKTKWLIIGATNNSIAFRNDGPADNTQSSAYFQRQVVDFTACKPQVMYWFERMVIDPCLWKWLPDEQNCAMFGNEANCQAITPADLVDGANWEYAPKIDPECGADMSKLSFYVGTCPTVALTQSPPLATA